MLSTNHTILSHGHPRKSTFKMAITVIVADCPIMKFLFKTHWRQVMLIYMYIV